MQTTKEVTVDVDGDWIGSFAEVHTGSETIIAQVCMVTRMETNMGHCEVASGVRDRDGRVWVLDMQSVRVVGDLVNAKWTEDETE